MFFTAVGGMEGLGRPDGGKVTVTLIGEDDSSEASA